MLDTLVDARQLVITQVKEWLEILVGYEARNRYEVRDESCNLVALVAEEGGGFGRWAGRQAFGRCRKATLHVLEPSGIEIARIEKPFRWYFQEVTFTEAGRPLGTVVRRLTLTSTRFAVLAPDGTELIAIERSFLDHFRFRGKFRVTLRDIEVATISKEWRGLVSEVFSDADRFGIEYATDNIPPVVKKLLFAATFLIDFTCFENNTGRGGLIDILGG
jgi:hypothetical protein